VSGAGACCRNPDPAEREKDLRNKRREQEMAFEQAQIPIQKTEEFEQLRSAIERAFAAEKVEKLLRKLQSSNIRIRRFEQALDRNVFDGADPVLVQSGKSAKQLYAALPLSDQALIREFYLERIEKVDAKIREKFRKVYQYY